MAVEVGQLRMMRDGTVVQVMSIGPEHTGYMGRPDGGDYTVRLWDVTGEIELHRAYGTVASYPLLHDAQRALAEASVTPPRVCPCCGTPRSRWPR